MASDEMNEVIDIAGRSVGTHYPPLMIAEMSGNHNQSLERAMKIVEAAARAGADVLKLQTYTPDTMTLNLSENEFFISNSDSLWQGTSLYDLYAKAHTPWQWHQPIMDYCKELGMLCFSSPFDATSVDFLETLNVPAYKIASFELVDIPLIEKVAATQKPLIMSTGMASVEEISDAVQAARNAGSQDIILLKCTSSYPADAAESNLATIQDFRRRFDVQVGLSDHTPGLGVAVASVALGATVIEKHFTLSRSEGGVDAEFSLEPDEFSQLVQECKTAHRALGKIHYGVTSNEEKSIQFRRSLYAAQDIQQGELLTPDNLRAIRPGYGLPPKYYTELLGQKAAQFIKSGTPMSWDLVGRSPVISEEAKPC